MVSPGHRHNVIGSQMSARTYHYSQLAFSAHTWVRNAECPKRADTTKARQTDRPTETLRAHSHMRAAQQVKTQQCATNELVRDPMWRLLRWTARACVREPFCSCCTDLLPRQRCVREALQVILLCLLVITLGHMSCAYVWCLPVVPPQLISLRAVQRTQAAQTSISAIVLAELRYRHHRIVIQIWPLWVNYVIVCTHTGVAVIKCLRRLVRMITPVANFPTISRQFNSVAL